MRRLIVAVGVLIFSSSVWGECLRVVDSGFETDERKVASSISWHATIENQCRFSYNADLTVAFVDGEGKTVYEARDLVTIGGSFREQAGKSEYIRGEYISQIESIEIAIEERKRPY